MATIQELREQRETLFKQAETLEAKGDALNAEETEAWSDLVDQVADLDNQIKQAETAQQASEDRKAKMDSLRQSRTGQRRTSPDSPTLGEVRVGRNRVEDDPKRGFRNLADFAQEIKDCGQSLHGIQTNQRIREAGFLQAAGTGMAQGVTSDGGVLVPPAFSKEIWDGARVQSDSMLQYCDTMPIDAGVESVTIPASAETSRADGSRWGGVRGCWKSELGALASSKPTFRDVKIEPQELYVFGYISDKLLRNAPGTASTILANAAADEINFKLGDSVFNGDGAGKPKGIIGHAATIDVAKESGQAAATVVAQNINKMYSRCHAKFRSGAAWFINQEVEPQLEALTMVVGTGGVPLYLPPGGIADAPLGRLKGLPVIPCEYAQALGTSGDIVLANLRAYAMGVRGMVDQSISMHLKFDYAQSAFRWIFEADGQPWLASTLTAAKGSTTYSPIVTLATRA